MSRTWIFATFFALGGLGSVTGSLAETPAELVADSAFQLVILPDTQYYTEDFVGDNSYNAQTRWIRDDSTLLTNLAFVVHMGDMTDDNAELEWDIADAAHDILDVANIRYSVMPGNHDYPDHGNYGARDTQRFNAHFGPGRFAALGYGPSHSNMGSKNDNNAVTFTAAGQDYLVVSLEFMPGKDATCWANQVISAHRDKRVIVATHAYLDRFAEPDQDVATSTSALEDNYEVIGAGIDTLWDELISRHNNIFMVLSGHITGTHYRTRPGSNGEPVHEILTDYQREGGENGKGWLRVLGFDPAGGGQGMIHSTVKSVLGVTSLCDGTGTSPCQYSSNPDATGNPPGTTYHSFSVPADLTLWDATRYVEAPLASAAKSYRDRTVNTVGTGEQRAPSVATDAQGNSIIVWQDDMNGNGAYNILARGFDPFGCERIPTFTVNTVLTGQQRSPQVAMDAAGNFVVVWEDDADGNDTGNVFMRGFSAAGTQRFPAIKVNSDSSGDQGIPDVAMDDRGNIAVVWEDDTDGNGTYQIWAKGYHLTPGNVLQVAFSEITVNTENDGQQRAPKIGMEGAGNFVVVWEDDSQSLPYYEIFARGYRFNALNQLENRFSDIRVNTVTNGVQIQPDIAVAENLDFVVTWTHDESPGSGFVPSDYDILARGYRINGTSAPLGRFSDIAVAQSSSGARVRPAVAIDSLGNSFITWADDSDGNNVGNVRARGFWANGLERHPMRKVNSGTPGNQLRPAISVSPEGRVAVAWEDDLNGNSAYQIALRGLHLP